MPGPVDVVASARCASSIALGGNAMTAPDGSARPEDQRAAITEAMEAVADLVVAGRRLVLTHGNGPQVGNLLVKNEIAASVVPPVPLDWCGAQTQGTIGVLVMDALDAALRATRRPAPVRRPSSRAPSSPPTIRTSPSRPSRSGATCAATRPR